MEALLFIYLVNRSIRAHDLPSASAHTDSDRLLRAQSPEPVTGVFVSAGVWIYRQRSETDGSLNQSEGEEEERSV